jgi:hypothetical protein
VFGSARQALRAAVELQRAFRTPGENRPVFPLPVGIGLDAGEAVPIEGGYRGGALNTAARLCSLAAPGQILASETVVSLSRRLEAIRFIERRATKVKGLEKPLRVIEVVPEEALPPLPEVAARRRAALTRGRIAIAAAGLAAVAGLTAFFVVRSSGADYLPSLDPDVLGTIDAKAAGIASQVELPGEPSAATTGGDAVWVASRSGRTVTRLDPDGRSRRLRSTALREASHTGMARFGSPTPRTGSSCRSTPGRLARCRQSPSETLPARWRSETAQCGW